MIKLSVIIPTVNRAKLLTRLLESLIHQTYPHECFEIIIVDNGSIDQTTQVVRNYKKKFINFRYIYESTLGLHMGRHHGMGVSNSKILVYCDDDIRASPTWLEGISESFEDQDVMLVGGNNLPDYETKPPKWVSSLWKPVCWGKILPYYSLLKFNIGVSEISPFFVWGCNFSIRKAVLLELGGFHPDSMPKNLIRFRGDGETAVSSGILEKEYKTIFNPKATVWHWVPKSRMTLEYIRKRAFAQGISSSYTDIRAIKHVSKKLIVAAKFRSLFALRNPLKKAFWKGYLFHQNEVIQDPELLKWVLKKHYMEQNQKIS